MGVVVLGVGGYFAYEPVKLLFGLQRKGFLEAPQQRTYEASTRKNLLAIYTALSFAHDSDGSYPAAAHWMDEVQKRIKTSDITQEDAEKKLVDPAFEGSPGKFGYALNQDCAGKYKGDLKPGTILVFMSEDTKRNASGNPHTDKPRTLRSGGNFGITIEGQVVPLP